MTRALITGASGFIGKNLLLSLPEDWDTVAVYFRSQDFPAFLEKKSLTRIKPLQIDLASPEAGDVVARQAESFDLCVYLAANGDPAVSSREPSFDLVSNTLTLLRLLERVSIGRMIYFSSGAVYDGLSGPVTPRTPVHPSLPYSVSNLASERYLEFFRKIGRIDESVAVRFFGAFGPYEPERKIYTRLVRRFAFEKDPRFTLRGDGRNMIDAMYIEDAVKALRLLMYQPIKEPVVDLYSGRPLSLKNLVEKTAAAFGLVADITCEGEVPEYIEFSSADQTMLEDYGFVPSVELEDGLHRLRDHLAQA